MLGVWDDRNTNTEGNLANARIYRKITLPKGLYYFGATYNTTYNISDRAYMFVSDTPLNTSVIPDRAIAFHRIADCEESSKDYYGVWFAVEEDDKEVCLGWQADLAEGSETQEFRVTKVALLRIADCDMEEINSLLDNVNSNLSALQIKNRFGNDSGQFTPEAYAEICEKAEEANKGVSKIEASEIMPLYFTLKRDWETFLASRNPGCLCPEGFDDNQTRIALVESERFSPADPTTTSRFTSPQYWTVENYEVPAGNEGVRSGLDNYSEEYSLNLGVWDDRFLNSQGDISDARIYRKVSLQPGVYFFGAHYNALYQMAKCYLFFNDEMLPTSQIESDALAWANINDAKIDDDVHGIRFTVSEPGDYYLGWQANLREGEGRQEFRADRIALMKEGPSGVEEIFSNEKLTLPDFSQPYELYTIDGRRISRPIPNTVYILRQNGQSWKIR